MQQAVTQKKQKMKVVCNSATGAPDSLTVQDTKQKLTSKGPRTSSSSNKEPKSGVKGTDSPNNDPEETKNECSEYNSPTGASDSLTMRDTDQNLTPKGPRTSSRQKKPPTTKNNDFFMVKDNKMTGINFITIFHQNICGLRKKTDELKSSMYPNFPHILCFSEHHLKNFVLDQINIDGYNLGAAYCRQIVKRGGVCIFVRNNLNYTNIDLSAYCKDQDREVCALNLKLTFSNLRIMTVYRAPTGNSEAFLHRLDNILKTLYKADSELIVCGDINIDYLSDSEKKEATRCSTTLL